MAPSTKVDIAFVVFMKSEKHKIQKLLRKLCNTRAYKFPAKGCTKNVGVPMKQGVYIIYDSRGIVVHVGRTQRAKRGLRQRLNNHLRGQSSFVDKYLNRRGAKLRTGYKFRYLLVNNPRTRALLEDLAIGTLCPRHLGLGE